jgi:hypothetical protein
MKSITTRMNRTSDHTRVCNPVGSLISELVESPNLVQPLVGPSWIEDILEHKGTITDRFPTNTNTPCPYLQQGTLVLVHFTRPDTNHPPSPVPFGSSSLDIAPAGEGWQPFAPLTDAHLDVPGSDDDTQSHPLPQSHRNTAPRRSPRLSTKRARYDPEAMGQGPKDTNAFKFTSDSSPNNNYLIVGMGASHVLFREEDSSILSHVQMSPPGATPFAILKAANGAPPLSIGRGLFTIKPITIVAHIFRDQDLVTNLMGIAPFAVKVCKAIFTSRQFSLYHMDHDPILTGERHAHNLWRIKIPPQPTAVSPPLPFPKKQVLLLPNTSDPDSEHVHFVHASLGSPPPTTFLKALARGYVMGEKQFPCLTTKMVRKYQHAHKGSHAGI